MAADPTRGRFPWGLTIASGLLLALLVFLGVWQVQRLQWKEGLIARAERVQDLPPADYTTALERGEFARIVLDCPGLATAPFVELQTISEGQAGVRLVSACRPKGFEFVFLVDRGFVADAISARPPEAESSSVVRIEGQLREPQRPGPMALPPEGRRFFTRDHMAMAKALGVSSDVLALMVFATTSSNPDWPALKPSAPPAAFSNNHLGYAITWFGLALALIAFYIALLRRKLAAPAAGAKDAS